MTPLFSRPVDDDRDDSDGGASMKVVAFEAELFKHCIQMRRCREIDKLNYWSLKTLDTSEEKLLH